MSFKVTITNSTLLTYTRTPVEGTSITRFQTFTVTLKGYLPVRLICLDDINKTDTPAAARVKDGTNEYDLGFSGEATFHITLNAGSYSIEGAGNASQTHDLAAAAGSSGVLAPVDFVTAQMRQDMASLNAWMAAAARLVNPIDTAYQDVIDLYTDVKLNATTWSSEVFPSSVTCASGIVDYCITAQTYLEGLKAAIDAYTDPKTPPSEKADAKTGILEMLRDLKGRAQVFYDEAQAVATKIGNLATKVSTNSAKSSELNTRYTNLIGPNSEEQKKLHKILMISEHKLIQQMIITNNIVSSLLLLQPMLGFFLLV